MDGEVEVAEDLLICIVGEGDVAEFDGVDVVGEAVHCDAGSSIFLMSFDAGEDLRGILNLRIGVEEPDDPLGAGLGALNHRQHIRQFLHGILDERGILQESDERAQRRGAGENIEAAAPEGQADADGTDRENQWEEKR